MSQIPVDKVSGGDEAVFDGIVDNSFGHVDDAVATDVGERACGDQSASKCVWEGNDIVICLHMILKCNDDFATSVQAVHHSLISSDGLIRIPHLCS